MEKSLRSKYRLRKISQDIKPNKLLIEDIEKLKEIYISFWGTVDLYTDKEFKRLIIQNLSYSYKIDNEVIAYCLIDYKKRENIAEIYLLCVKKEYQGYHLGKTLLSFCLDNCCKSNIKNFCLHVSTENKLACNLYKKLGFTVKKFIKDYYHDEKDNDAYYMILNI